MIQIRKSHDGGEIGAVSAKSAGSGVHKYGNRLKNLSATGPGIGPVRQCPSGPSPRGDAQGCVQEDPDGPVVGHDMRGEKVVQRK